jgi:hypothetical protein
MTIGFPEGGRLSSSHRFEGKRTMQAANVVQLYEIGQRGRPVRLIAPGDLDDPYAKASLWKRVRSGFAAFADALREARELEAQMLGPNGRFRNFRED